MYADEGKHATHAGSDFDANNGSRSGKGYDMVIDVDILAYQEWKSWPEERRRFYLTNAFCSKCCSSGRGRVTSFARKYSIRRGVTGLFLDGKCVRCGSPIRRSCD